MTAPGFVPDHASVDFYSLYSPSDVRDYDVESLRTALKEMNPVSTDQTGQQAGLPAGVVIIADGNAVLKALLRAGWYESARVNRTEQPENAHYLFGRVPDAVFRIQRNKKHDRNELYLWMSPMLIDGKSVWIAQIRHFIGQKTRLEQTIFGARVDPDIDDSRNYFAQNMWYSQNLEQFAWLKTAPSVPIEATRTDFSGSEYFTNGYLLVTWLSGAPVSLLETKRLDWDNPSFER